jgi:hypothetical protein
MNSDFNRRGFILESMAAFYHVSGFSFSKSLLVPPLGLLLTQQVPSG